MSSEKTVLRLAEQMDAAERLTAAGSDLLVATIAQATEDARRLGCEEFLAFATSAIREARNARAVLARIRRETGVDLPVLSGQDEARLTFLAVRRWFGWSSGQLLVLDIGGGSLELAAGVDEDPEHAWSLPLGAARVTRTRFHSDPPTRRELAETRDWLDAELAPVAKLIRRGMRREGRPDRVVATSKTFRTLARLTGSAPSSVGPRRTRTLTAAGLRQLISFISRMSAADLAELEGVDPGRAYQLVAGALVAEATMRALRVDEVELCPWALREGVILRRLDQTNGTVQTSTHVVDNRDGDTGGSRGVLVIPADNPTEEAEGSSRTRAAQRRDESGVTEQMGQRETRWA